MTEYIILTVKQKVVIKLGDQVVGGLHGPYTSGVSTHYSGYDLQGYLNAAAGLGWRLVASIDDTLIIENSEGGELPDCELIRAEGCRYCYPELANQPPVEPEAPQPKRKKKKQPPGKSPDETMREQRAQRRAELDAKLAADFG